MNTVSPAFSLYFLLIFPAILWVFHLRICGFTGSAFKIDHFGPFTRERRRKSGLHTLSESRPYVGTYECYLESRWTAYKLFGIPIASSWFSCHAEIPMNAIIANRFIGTPISGPAVDAAFPPELQTGFKSLSFSLEVQDSVPASWRT